MSDPALDRLENELRESRFRVWDVETFLANRHRAKIEALTATHDKWKQRRQVAQEIVTGAFAFIGYVAVITAAGLWLLTGEFIPQ